MSTDAASTEARNVRIIIRLPPGPLEHQALHTRSSLCVPRGRRSWDASRLNAPLTVVREGKNPITGRPRCHLSTPATYLSCLSHTLTKLRLKPMSAEVSGGPSLWIHGAAVRVRLKPDTTG